MRENRELLLFAVFAVLVALLAWSRVSDAYTAVRAPGLSTYPAKDVQRPPRVLLTGAPIEAERDRGRSAFAPPRELLPLDPLQLPEPPVPALPVRRPAVQPGLVGAAARAYRLPASELGDLDLGLTSAQPVIGVGGGGPALDQLDRPGSAAVTPGFGERDADQDLDLGADADPSESYDWIVRGVSGSRVYGRLLNEDKHGLASRPGEDIRFQQVSLRTGRALGLPFDVPRGEVIEFGLARTFENDYILRSRALGTGAGGVAGRTELAREMLAAADREERALEYALAEARLAVEHSPADPFTARLLATILREAHDAEGQLTVYREALARQTVSAPLLADYAELVRRQGLTERAAELLEQARALSRLAAEVPLVQGLLARDLGDHEAALAHFQAADGADFSPPFEERQKRRLDLLLGETLLGLGRVAEARREVDRLLLDDPADALALRLLGGCHAAEGRWLDAAEAYAGALVSRPDDGRLLTSAGLVAWQLDDGRGALGLFDQALAADPFHAPYALEAKGFVSEDGGLAQNARDLYDQALRIQPDDPELLYRLGRVQRLDGDLEGARATLRRALRLGGPDVLLLSELARVAVGRGRHAAATRYVREALRLEPDNAQLLWLLGLAQLFDGDLLTAVETLDRATRAGIPGAHAALGVARYRLGDEQAALDHLDEVGRALAGQDDDPTVVYAATQAAAIRDNLSKRQWVDAFGRGTLQRGWTERLWDGSPQVFLGPECLHIKGRMEQPREDERPGVSRTVEGQAFVSADVTLSAGAGADSRFGLVLTHKQVKGVQGQLPKARLEIWVDAGGQVRLSALDNFDTQVLDGVAVPGLRLPPDTSVTLGIERLDALTGSFRFLVDGRPVGDPVVLKALRDMNRNTLHLDVYGDAPPGRSCDVTLCRVRIVQLP